MGLRCLTISVSAIKSFESFTIDLIPINRTSNQLFTRIELVLTVMKFEF